MKFIFGALLAGTIGLMLTTAAVVTVDAGQRQAQEWRDWR